jgi:hypothetical protein
LLKLPAISQETSDNNFCVGHYYTEEEGHGYELAKRKAVYPFLAKHLQLDLTVITGEDGQISEKGIVIESFKKMKVFSESNPRRGYAVLKNDDVKW